MGQRAGVGALVGARVLLATGGGSEGQDLLPPSGQKQAPEVHSQRHRMLQVQAWAPGGQLRPRAWCSLPPRTEQLVPLSSKVRKTSQETLGHGQRSHGSKALQTCCYRTCRNAIF